MIPLRKRKVVLVGKYTILAEVSRHLVEVLTNGLVPEILTDKNEIGLCCPDERGDLVVGVCLYDIQENENYRITGMVNHNLQEQAYPPVFLSLYYRITVWSSGDIQYRAEEEYRILGRIIQLLRDENLWAAENFGNDNVPDIRVEYLETGLEEKMKTWNSSSLPYRTSLFYRIGPVSLDSARTRAVRRVMDVDIQVKEEEKHGKGAYYLESAGGNKTI